MFLLWGQLLSCADQGWCVELIAQRAALRHWKAMALQFVERCTVYGHALGANQASQTCSLWHHQQKLTVDPFLMLDFFHVAPPAGFPSHPHRGFETVT